MLFKLQYKIAEKMIEFIIWFVGMQSYVDNVDREKYPILGIEIADNRIDVFRAEGRRLTLVDDN